MAYTLWLLLLVLLLLQGDLLPVCRELGIGVLAYSPLGRGLLTGGCNIAGCQCQGVCVCVWGGGGEMCKGPGRWAGRRGLRRYWSKQIELQLH